MVSGADETRQIGDEAGRFRRRLIYGLLIAISSAVLTAAILNASPLQSANDRSRWCTVWSLVERGTYRIDSIAKMPAWSTIDKVRHEGHFYSSKPPLYPTLVAGIYWCVKSVTGLDLFLETNQTTRVILLLVNLLPFVAALVILAAFVERYAQTDSARFFVVGCAGFATLLTPFLVTLNNHTVAAISVVFALYPLARILIDEQRAGRYFAITGFAAAFASCSELPAAAFGVASFLLLLRKSPQKTLLIFVPAALVPLAGYFYTNYLVTGGFKPFYAYYGTEKYLYVHEGVPSYWNNPQGLDKAGDSSPTYLFHCTLGHHGILSLSPIYLLTVVTWLISRGRRSSLLSSFLWLGCGLTFVVLGFYLSRTENYNYGGNTAGLRWMLWLIPFWLIGMIPTIDRWGDRRWFLAVAGVLCAVSTFSAFYPITNPWRAPWLFTLMEQWKWIDYPGETIEPFERPLHSWFPSLPEDGSSGDEPWIEFNGHYNELGAADFPLRLQDRGIQQIAGRDIRRIAIIRAAGSPDAQVRDISIDVEGFYQGQPVEDFLVWPDESTPESDRIDAAIFVSGLPFPRVDDDAASAQRSESTETRVSRPVLREFRPGVIRYLKTPLRDSAFRCQRAASQVDYQPPGADRRYRYRCDLWLCPDVPFGVVQVITTVSDLRTNEIVSRRRLMAIAASQINGGSQ